jgi:uncharacterized DUF497 family protein
VRFESHRRKAAAIVRKHGVAFEDNATVFHDPLSVTLDAETTPKANDG